MFNLTRTFSRLAVLSILLIAHAAFAAAAAFTVQPTVAPSVGAYGFEIWEETDYQAAAGPNPLKFVRTYISDVEGNYALGQRKKWR